jgi:drug/metabolite transporter (DMT)-like permease
MLLSVLGLSVMQSLVRYLGSSVSSWTKTFYRSLFTIFFLLVWMLISREKIRFNNWPLLLMRGLAVLLFKERFSPWILAPLAAALVGLYLIVNPSFQGFTLGHGIGLCAALLGGIARAALRQLRRTDSPGNIVLLFMSFAGVLSGIGVTLIPGQSWRFTPSASLTEGTIWLLLFAIGLFSAFAHIMVTVAYRRLSTATASIMTMLILPITALIAVLYFHESLTVNKIVGGLLITAAGIGVSAAPLLQRSSVADPNH